MSDDERFEELPDLDGELGALGEAGAKTGKSYSHSRF